MQFGRLSRLPRLYTGGPDHGGLGFFSNPQLAGADLPDARVDPASWVNIHLRMAQATGDPLEITLLRPVKWLAQQLAETAALDCATSRHSPMGRTGLQPVHLRTSRLWCR